MHLLLALVAVGTVTGPLLLQGAKPLWEEGARSIEQIVKACPTTRIYAASGWALGPAAKTKAARREDPVFRRAYQVLARTPRLYSALPRTEPGRGRSSRSMPGARLVRAHTEFCRG